MRTGTAAPAPAPREPARVRNVALVGPSGAGTTTLVEGLLVAAGALDHAGDVQDGTTVGDADEVEQLLGHSVTLAVASVEHRGVKVNLLDTPGAGDLVGALRAGLRAADAALFVVSGAGGLDAVTAQLWADCEAAGLPRAVVVTQLDRARADFDEAVALCQRLLSEDVLPLHLPMHDDDGTVAGLIALLDQVVVDHSSGRRDERPADPEHVALVADLRAELVEAVLAESDDEALLDRYLDGDEPEAGVLRAQLAAALARGHLTPALAAAPLRGVGVVELLDLLVDGFPSPLQHACPPVTRPDGSPAAPLECDPTGPLAAEVVRTATDPALGRVVHVRVLSGTLRPGDRVQLARQGDPAPRAGHVGALASPLGTALRPVASCPAGDVCVVAGLATAATGDTLSSPDDPLLLAPWALPEPQLPVAVEPVDDERLRAALTDLLAEDPTVRVERRSDTGQLLLWCTGPLHADVLLRRLRTRDGVAVGTREVRVPQRETVAGPGTGTGRARRSDAPGAGDATSPDQDAVVVLGVSPGAPGSGVVVDPGSLPAPVLAGVEQGVRAQAERGVGDRGPLVDVAVALVDVRAPSPADAAAAAAQALREATAAAGTVLLEPWWQVEVHVPTAFARTVVSDLSGRGARDPRGEQDPEDDARSVVRAQLPERALVGYAPALRAASHGTGWFTRRPLGYAPVAR